MTLLSAKINDKWDPIRGMTDWIVTGYPNEYELNESEESEPARTQMVSAQVLTAQFLEPVLPAPVVFHNNVPNVIFNQQRHRPRLQL